MKLELLMIPIEELKHMQLFADDTATTAFDDTY